MTLEETTINVPGFVFVHIAIDHWACNNPPVGYNIDIFGAENACWPRVTLPDSTTWRPASLYTSRTDAAKAGVYLLTARAYAGVRDPNVLLGASKPASVDSSLVLLERIAVATEATHKMLASSATFYQRGTIG